MSDERIQQLESRVATLEENYLKVAQRADELLALVQGMSGLIRSLETAIKASRAKC